VEKYEDFFKNDHIVMGYRPNGKTTRIFQKWLHCNGLPAQLKNTRIFQIGHIVMGYLPSGEKYEDFSKVVTL